MYVCMYACMFDPTPSDTQHLQTPSRGTAGLVKRASALAECVYARERKHDTKLPGKGDEDNEEENAKVDDIIDALDDCCDQNANTRMCARGLQHLDEVQDHDCKTCADQ
jgi:hypothetical protein